MKKLTKRIAAIAASAIMVATMAITASAEHYTSSGMPCNSTFYTLSHYNLMNTSTGTHAYTCTVTYYVYRHGKACASCGTALGESRTYRCTEIHTCGNVNRDCVGVKCD